MKNILKILGILFLLISCKEEIEDNTGIYTPGKVEIGEIKLFTKSGEIKDSKTIFNFIKEHDKAHYFIQNTDSNIYVENLNNIVILPSNKAILINFGDSISYNIISKNQILYLESKDTTQYTNENINPIYTKMLLYKPLYLETFYEGTGVGSTTVTKLKQCIYITLSNGVITYPLLTYNYFQSYQGGYSSQSSRYINNVFNEESLELLSLGDTVAIQQNKLKFIK